MRTPLAIALAAALAGPAAARAHPTLRPALGGDRNYGEAFTFIADLADGRYVQVSFGFTNLVPGSRAVCRAVVASTQAPAWSASDRVGAHAVAWRDGPGETLSVGPCSAAVDGDRTVVEAPLEGAAVRLEFGGRPARLPFPQTFVSLPTGKYATEVLLYRVPVRATVRLPRAEARAVEGEGYLDHSRSSMPPRDLAARWVRFRALRGGRGLLLLAREGRDGAFDPAWTCTDATHCTRLTSFRVERAGEGKAPSFRVALVRDGGGLELRSGPLLLRDAPVEDLGVLGKMVGPLVGSPVTYVYRGTASDGAAGPVEGILEVELAEE